MRERIIFYILLGVIFICGCILQEKSVRLEYKYKKGDVLKYKLSTISKGTITLTGLPTEETSVSPIGIQTKTKCIFTQKVNGVDESGIADIEISYNLFQQDIKIEGDKTWFSFFGKKKENPFLNSLEGKKFNIKIGKDGSLLKIDGIEEHCEQILAQMPEEIPDELIHKFKYEFEKNMRSVIEENYNRLPLEEMKKGDSWIHELNYNIPFLCTAYGKFTYTIEEFTQVKGLECVKIGIDMSMNFLEKEINALLQQLNIPSLELKFKGDVHGKGEMLFAYQEGKLIRTNLGMNINIGAEDEARGMKMHFDSHTLIELQ